MGETGHNPPDSDHPPMNCW